MNRQQRRAEKAKARGSCNDLRGLIPESWACIDCGVNTAPGLVNRAQAEQAFANYDGRGIKQTVGKSSEVYTVTPDVWQAAGMEPYGGCLCIGCLEKRIGRVLAPRDFPDHPFRLLPGTKRLLERRAGVEEVTLMTEDLTMIAEDMAVAP